MKILHAGWWIRPYRGGGLVIYSESLMHQQIRKGHEVHYFCGGRYNPLFQRAYIKNYNKDGIHVHELVNSPNLIWDFDSIKFHISNLPAEKQFDKVLDEVQPDVVHIQELESLSANIIEICKKHKVPTFMSLHNYWPLCPQRDLIDYNNAVCTDYQGGHKCMECNVLPGSGRIQWMMTGYSWLENIPPVLRKILRFFYDYYMRTVRSGQDIKPLEEHFTERRKEFLKRLNTIRLIAVSDRVRDIYVSCGINEKNISTIHISSNAINFIKQRKIKEIDQPIRFGYLGGFSYKKGLHTMIEAFKRVDENDAVLHLYGNYNTPYGLELKNNNIKDNIKFFGRYNYEELNNVLDSIDVGIVPAIWEDNSPQVVFELLQAGIPVIGSRIGGIPDFVKDGVNGLLFEPGNTDELYNKIGLILNDPGLIIKLSANTKPHKTLDNHCDEIISFYEQYQ